MQKSKNVDNFSENVDNSEQRKEKERKIKNIFINFHHYYRVYSVREKNLAKDFLRHCDLSFSICLIFL